EKTTEIERLRKEIEQRDTLIAALQAESNEHQRKLGKLRGSESETMRLRALGEQDRATIEALEREVAKLKAELAGERVSERTAARWAAASDLPVRVRDHARRIDRRAA